MGNPSPFSFGTLERTLEVKVGDEVRRLPMLSINDGRELADILNDGFELAKTLDGKDVDAQDIQRKINETRNKAVKFLGAHGVPEDIAGHLEKYASFEEVVAFATYLRIGFNIMDRQPEEPVKVEDAQPSKKKSRSR